MFDRFDTCQRGRAGGKLLQKLLYLGRRSSNTDDDAATVVIHFSPQVVGLGQLVDHGTKTHSLYRPLDANFYSDV
jgi:hypothetical protein